MSEEERCRRVGVSWSLRGGVQRGSPTRILPPHGGRKYLFSHTGVMAIEVPQNEEISGGGKNGGRKAVGSAISRRGANRGAYTLRNDSEEKLLREMLTPT